jgi:hypothetical protein
MSTRRATAAAAAGKKIYNREPTPSTAAPTDQRPNTSAPTTHTKDLLENMITPEVALQTLRERGLLPEDRGQLSLQRMVEYLLSSGKDEKRTEDELRIILVATGRILNSDVMQMIAEATDTEIGFRLTSIQEHECKQAKEATDKTASTLANEKATLDKDRIDLETTRLQLDREKEELTAIRKNLASSAASDHDKQSESTKIDTLLNKVETLLETTAKQGQAIEELKKKEKEPVPSWSDLTGGPIADLDRFTGPREAPTYASIARFVSLEGPTRRAGTRHEQRNNPDVDKAKTTEGKRDRQLALDGEETENGNAMAGLTDADAFEKAKQALGELVKESTDEGRPQSIEILGVKVQRGKGLLIEMSTKEEKNWLIRPDICDRFTSLMGLAGKYRPRKYPILAEQVPTAFDINAEDAIEQLAQTNGFEKEDITDLRWIRNPNNRTPDQRSAHFIINCRTKHAANEWIRHRKMIQGKEVESSKLISNALRCFKCQHYGHKANRCIAEQRCGTCGGGHDTKVCNNRNSPFCVTCNEKGHPTWDKTCPGYYAKSASQWDKLADKYYTYHITEDPETWELAADRIRSRVFKPANEPRPSFIPNERWAQPNPPRDSFPLAENPPRTPPSMAAAPHPRPDNIAQPTQGGRTLAPRRQMTLFGSQSGRTRGLGLTPIRPTQPTPSPTVNTQTPEPIDE